MELAGARLTLGSKNESVRLDVWLDVACLFATRSKAKAACEGGKVEVNGARSKAHRELRVGDRLTLSLAPGVRREVIVRDLADHSIPKAQARLLYEDVTPALSPEAVEARRLDRMLAPRHQQGKPDRRERRERRKQKGW
jgi:ribosome-associated heat shock protein Hsp15